MNKELIFTKSKPKKGKNLSAPTNNLQPQPHYTKLSRHTQNSGANWGRLFHFWERCSKNGNRGPHLPLSPISEITGKVPHKTTHVIKQNNPNSIIIVRQSEQLFRRVSLKLLKIEYCLSQMWETSKHHRGNLKILLICLIIIWVACLLCRFRHVAPRHAPRCMPWGFISMPGANPFLES